MRKLTGVVLAACAAGSLVLVGCEKETPKTPAESMKDAGDAMKKAGEDLQDATHEAAEDVKDATGH
jgi:hypothetical protein